MKTKHTPTPWKVVLNNPDKYSSPIINGPESQPVATVDSDRGIDSADAAFIVTACNSHEDLVKSIQFTLEHGTFDKRGRVKSILEEALAKAGVKI